MCPYFARLNKLEVGEVALSPIRVPQLSIHTDTANPMEEALTGALSLDERKARWWRRSQTTLTLSTPRNGRSASRNSLSRSHPVAVAIKLATADRRLPRYNSLRVIQVPSSDTLMSFHAFIPMT